MKKFESLCNEYRENKRLIEELQAMNDSIKLDILAIMGNDEMHVEGAAKPLIKRLFQAVSIQADSRKNTRICSPNTAEKQVINVFVYCKGVLL